MSTRSATLRRPPTSEELGVDAVAVRVLDDVLIQQLTIPGRTIRKAAGRDEIPLLACILVLSGGVSLSMTHVPSQQWRVGSLQAFFLVSRGDYLLNWSMDAEAIVVSLPEKVVEGFGATVRPHTRLPSLSSALVEAAIGFFSGLCSAEPVTDRIAGYALTRLSEELVGSLLLESNGAHREHVDARPSLFHRALAMIASRRADPELTPMSLAAELAVSLRHLQRAFHDQGTSPTAEIRRLRVELAVQLLTEERYRVLPIADVSAYAGFRTMDDMRRSFRLAGLPSPSEVRRSRGR